MNYRPETPLDPTLPVDWLVLPLFSDQKDASEQWLNQLLDGELHRLRVAGDLTGEAQSILTLYPAAFPFGQRVMLCGLGNASGVTLSAISRLGALIGKTIGQRAVHRVRMVLPSHWGDNSQSQSIHCLAIGLGRGSHSPALRQREAKRFSPEEVLFYMPQGNVLHDLPSILEKAQATARAVNLARDLVNEPPSDLTPMRFAERCAAEAAHFGFRCDILNEDQIRAERMGCLLGVAKGSVEPPRVVVLRHGQGSPALGFVGKGVTFDSGGLSLKSNEQMLDMKCDMAGAATVLSAFTAIAQLRLPGCFVGLLALVENMPGPAAMKLGDVLTSRNGKTIEIGNTDAEGRLILADMLDYAQSLKIDHLIDLATLTGACMVALGTDVAGLFSNHPAWQTEVQTCAESTGEKVWPMPMFKEYGELLKSPMADLKNVGGKFGGAITAAKFLEQFVGNTPWAHLDIAGPAFASEESSSRDAGGTGCFAPTLIEVARRWPTSSTSVKE